MSKRKRVSIVEAASDSIDRACAEALAKNLVPSEAHEEALKLVIKGNCSVTTNALAIAVALANDGFRSTYIEDDAGCTVVTIAHETKRGKVSEWAWYVRHAGGEELGPFSSRIDAALAADKAGWIPKSFYA